MIGKQLHFNSCLDKIKNSFLEYPKPNPFSLNLCLHNSSHTTIVASSRRKSSSSPQPSTGH